MRHAFAHNEPQETRDPVSLLVNAIIGARTLDEVSHAAFERLRQRFPRWDLAIGTDPAELARLIAPVAHAEVKARQLPRALKKIETWSGALNLDFLLDWDQDMAMQWLEALPGVGPGIAAAVLSERH